MDKEKRDRGDEDVIERHTGVIHKRQKSKNSRQDQDALFNPKKNHTEDDEDANNPTSSVLTRSGAVKAETTQQKTIEIQMFIRQYIAENGPIKDDIDAHKQFRAAVPVDLRCILSNEHLITEEIQKADAIEEEEVYEFDVADSTDGESFVSESDEENRDLVCQPEPKSARTIIPAIKAWLEQLPKLTRLRISEGRMDVIGKTVIMFGIPALCSIGEKVTFSPYSNPDGDIHTHQYGFAEFEGFQQVTQALFFYFGGVRSWMYRDLIPYSAYTQTQVFAGCGDCSVQFTCWWREMREYRRKLETEIVSDRMSKFVARMVAEYSEVLAPVWSNKSDQHDRRRLIWRGLFQEEDLGEIFAPLRPGVDIETILATKDGEVGMWRNWLYDSAASLADDVFIYHIAQGLAGKEVAQCVFDRHERVGERIPAPNVSIESLPTRATFKCPSEPPNIVWK